VVERTTRAGRARCPGVARERVPAAQPALRAAALQHAVGNRALARALSPAAETRPGGPMVEIPREGLRHPALELLNRPDTHLRVPTFADLKKVYTSTKLRIPEAVVKERLGQLLGRMQRENRLKSKQPIPDILAKIFPAPGVIDEAAFKAAVDVADRTAIYQSVLDTETKVKPPEKAGLRALMADAASEVTTAEGDSTGLTQVFGSKAPQAKAFYGKTKKALGEVSKDMNSKVTTDYNLDDPETFLGGWANFGNVGPRHMHLLLDVVKGVDPAESKATLIHEASHLAHPSIVDLGYYGTPGYEAMDEDKKIANAAHFEEIPRRQMGISKFGDGHGGFKTFTPGILSHGGAQTWEDKLKKKASDDMQQAWDAAVDTHTGLRAVRKALLKGNKSVFTANKAFILEASDRMDLTVHKQDPAKAEVTPLDVTLAESIARAMGLIGSIVQREPVKRWTTRHWGSAAEEEKWQRDTQIRIGVVKYGQLLTPDRSMKLIDWFIAHFKAVPLP
jgi:hypothetical protein